MISIGFSRKVATADDFTFLDHCRYTSIELMLVLCVHLGERLFSLAGAMASRRFFSIFTYGFMYELGLMSEYLVCIVEGASRLMPNAISGFFFMGALSFKSSYLPSKNLSIVLYFIISRKSKGASAKENLLIPFCLQVSYIYIKLTKFLDMLDQAITANEHAFSYDLCEEIEWIINNDYLHEQLYRTLIEEIHLLASNEISYELEEQLVELIQHFVQKISMKTKHIAQSFSLEIAEHRLKILEYQASLHEKQEHLDSLNETIESLNLKIGNWQSEYDSLKGEYAEMQEKYELRLREIKREKKEIKQTFRIVQENTELERALLENLQIEKEEISGQIIYQQREKQVLIGELEMIKQKCLENEHRLHASASKISWQEKRIAKLEEQAMEKDKLIRKLMQEFQQHHREGHKMPKPAFHSQEYSVTKSFTEENHEEVEEVEEKKHVSFVESFKLSEILNIHEDYELLSKKNEVLSVKKSFNEDQEQPNQDLEINKSFGKDSQPQMVKTQLNDQPQQTLPYPSRVNIPDFYLAHFLLTSQAIKIKLNCEEYLGIDLVNHYPDVVRERVPFHMWDEWIKSKLKELAS